MADVSTGKAVQASGSRARSADPGLQATDEGAERSPVSIETALSHEGTASFDEAASGWSKLAREMKMPEYLLDALYCRLRLSATQNGEVTEDTSASKPDDFTPREKSLNRAGVMVELLGRNGLSPQARNLVELFSASSEPLVTSRLGGIGPNLFAYPESFVERMTDRLAQDGVPNQLRGAWEEWTARSNAAYENKVLVRPEDRQTAAPEIA